MDGEFKDRSEIGTIAVAPGPPARVVLVGDFDAANGIDVVEAFALVPAGDVILDLADVTFCCSAFLKCLLTLQQRIVAGGHRLELCAISPVMSRLLTLTGTDALFPINAEQ